MAKLTDSFGGTVEANIPEDVEWIDDSFYIKKTRFGLYTSILKDPWVNTSLQEQLKTECYKLPDGI